MLTHEKRYLLVLFGPIEFSAQFGLSVKCPRLLLLDLTLKKKSMWANLGTVSSSDVDGKQFYKEFLYCIMLVSSLGT